MNSFLKSIFRKQPKRFFSYRNRTLDVSGLKVGLDNIPNMPDIEVGKLKLSETQTKVQDELIRLDLLQFSLTQDLNEVGNDELRDNLLEKIIETKIAMLSLVTNQKENIEPVKKKELIPEFDFQYDVETEKYSIKEDIKELLSKIGLSKERIRNNREPYFTVIIKDNLLTNDIYEQEKFNLLRDKLHEEVSKKLEVAFLPHLHSILDGEPTEYYNILLSVLNYGVTIVSSSELKIDAWEANNNRSGFSFWISKSEFDEIMVYNNWNISRDEFIDKLHLGFYTMSIFPPSVLLKKVVPKFVISISVKLLNKDITLDDANKKHLSYYDIGLG